MTAKSIKSRFAVSFLANVLRGALNFLSSLLIARGLGPFEFGNFIFLVGSFTALKTLMDMGASDAFYTFISARPRGRKFILSYIGWQSLQLLLPLAVIGLFLPAEWLRLVWVGQERGIIILALIALFLQQQAWQVAVQIGESRRLTHRVQSIDIGISLTNLCLVGLAWSLEIISAKIIFSIIIVEYVIALFAVYKMLSFDYTAPAEPFHPRETLEAYLAYCLPLALLAVLGFAYEFADRWFLQHYGGAKEQGFYGIGERFAAVSLLATTSILRIFWKEIAEACENRNIGRMHHLFIKVSRVLFMVSAAASGFLIFWSKEIIGAAIGASYAAASSALAIMFLFPMHQSLGQIGITMLAASKQTRAKLVFGALQMMAGIPVAYFVLAPADAAVPGLSLGSVGIAAKMVVLNAIFVNAVYWWISRGYGWKMDWTHQCIVLGIVLLCGWFSHGLVQYVPVLNITPLAVRGGVALAFYCAVISAVIWHAPSLVGLQKVEMREMALRVFKRANDRLGFSTNA